jgi:hypothetical protein
MAKPVEQNISIQSRLFEKILNMNNPRQVADQQHIGLVSKLTCDPMAAVHR